MTEITGQKVNQMDPSGTLLSTDQFYVSRDTEDLSATYTQLINYNQGSTGAVNQTFTSKLQQTVSVKDFGATGDGATNDTVAVQAAITYVNSIGGGSVYAPRGTYVCGSVNLFPNVKIYGDGAATIFKQNTSLSTLGLFTCNSGSPTVFISNITLRDFQVLGNSVAQGFSEFIHLIIMSGVKNVLIDNIQFNGFQGDGLYLGSGSGGQVRHNIGVNVQNCTFDGINKANRNAISIIDGDNIDILNCKFANCTASNMPGAIDMEPDATPTAVIKNIKIIFIIIFSYLY